MSDLHKKYVDYIQLSGKLLEAAEKQASDNKRKQDLVENLIPDVVGALVENRRLQEGQAKEAAAMLSDHALTLEILANVAKHRLIEEAKLGNGVPAVEKRASAGLGRQTSEDSDSFRMFYERIVG